MKILIVSIAALLLAACSSTPPPTSMLDSDWQQFGYDRAIKGLIVQSDSKLNNLLTGSELKENNYQAYLMGYKNGQTEYCEQSAYILGVVGKPYNGICDQIDWTFSQDYNSGRHSTAGGM
ncbi:DUF2799 domain-containing protein [Aliivibrio sifiae]|jgi:hypothetical protein|uniref:DUF2799 domain-containing protein n=1 Tax=Aliivibrio sifiae TaxID=566293 RepID=A0A2S7XCF9_9GAMM|nr:DUF2799 domain-containing protein [Aliivibrio sifiae]PQJ89031.1 hypothetical protein BTO22_05275 [Aliivibrio sifiae]